MGRGEATPGDRSSSSGTATVVVKSAEDAWDCFQGPLFCDRKPKDSAITPLVWPDEWWSADADYQSQSITLLEAAASVKSAPLKSQNA